MDEYQQVRPESPDYAADVQDIAERLRAGHTVTLNLTARMTRQRILIANASAVDGTAPMEVGPGLIDRYWIVGRFEQGLYIFDKGRGMNAPGYIKDKLGLAFGGDAEILADFLDDLSDVA